MNYDDVIARARSIDPGPQPGPSFAALSRAASEAGDSRRRRPWLAIGLVSVAAAAAAVAVLVSSTQTGVEDHEGTTHNAAPMGRASTTHDGAASRRARERRTGTPRGDASPDNAPSVAPEVAPEDAVTDTDAEPTTDVSSEPKPSRPRPRPQSADELYGKAEALMGAKKWAAAAKTLRTFVRRHRKHPSRGDALADLARVEERRHRTQAALCVYQTLQHDYPKHPLAQDAGARVESLSAKGADPDACKHGR